MAAGRSICDDCTRRRLLFMDLQAQYTEDIESSVLEVGTLLFRAPHFIDRKTEVCNLLPVTWPGGVRNRIGIVMVGLQVLSS